MVNESALPDSGDPLSVPVPPAPAAVGVPGPPPLPVVTLESPSVLASTSAPAPPVLTASAEPVLRTLGLGRRFGGVAAVRDLSLTVRRGETYGFLGRNGAGKTTTIRMLMGIVAPDRGKIEFFGEAVRRTPPRLKRRIGYVSQEQNFYPWMDARRIGRFVGAFFPTWDAQEYDRLLQVLDVPPQRRIGHLSGGTRVKLGLALALAHRPELLVLDEPTAGLDPVARREFLDIVDAQARRHGRTTFFSTHRIEEVERVAHRIGVIHDGMLQFEGGLDELRRSIRCVIRPTSDPGAAATLPAGGRLLQRQVIGGGAHELSRERLVVQADPAWWASSDFGSGAEVTDLSLEDTLMAIAGRSFVDV